MSRELLMGLSMVGITVFTFYLMWKAGFIASLDILFSNFRYDMDDMIKQEVDIMFPKWDLPIKRIINVSKYIQIELYDLPRVKNIYGNMEFDKDNLDFLELRKIINANISFELDVETSELSCELPDFESSEYKLIYIELIRRLTSFDMSNFVFKSGEYENDFNKRFKLIDIESDFIDDLKKHTDEMIQQIFEFIILELQENGLGDIFK